LPLFARLDAAAQAVALAVIEANLSFLSGAYQAATCNLWEEEYGASFFARSVQLKCFEMIAGNTIGIPVPGWLGDRQRGIGPMLGRYPGDVYDGDTDLQAGDHPWALSTGNFAELYYRLAAQITASGAVPLDDLSARFFGQVGVDGASSASAAALALRTAGDQMLQAIVFHSDHLELSEQFDANSGYEKSVANLSWSYAAFLSAVRARV
jgi:hypothetical protein